MKYKITALLVALSYLVFNIFIIFTSLNWIKKFSPVERYNLFKIIFLIIYIFLMITPILSFIARKNILEVYLIKIGNMFLGLFGVISVFVLIGYLVYYLFFKNYQHGYYLTGLICTILIVIVYTYSTIHSEKMKETKYNITMNKPGNIKIALLSDLHLGYNNGYKDVLKMQKIINDSKVDVVLITGDIFDNNIKYIEEKDKLKKAFQEIQSKYGIYGVYGNHDVEEKLLLGFSFDEIKDLTRNSEMEKFLEECNINMLNDEYVLVNNEFYLVGRYDASKTGISERERLDYKKLTKGIKQKYPIIVLEHEPIEYNIIKENADLVVSGHTHNGQVFPFNLLLKLVMENSYGHIKIDNMNAITSAGSGIWGPHIRLGTTNEVVIIEMSEKNESSHNIRTRI